MIRVRRPSQVPDALAREASNKRRGICSAFTRAPAKYTSGAGTFTFDSDVYAHDEVKASLRTAQHGKCAFCESQVTHIAYGDVEHFRPKAAFRQGDAGPLERPGYYWLAYEWTNLLFSCELCNQRHKKNAFPLVDPSRRARSHRDDVAAEEPVFVDPADTSEDPATQIAFRHEVPYGITPRGEGTINALGLRRDSLNEMRKDFLATVRATFLVAYVISTDGNPRLAPDVPVARAFLRRAVADAGQYAAMIRAAIPEWEKEFGVRAA